MWTKIRFFKFSRPAAHSRRCRLTSRFESLEPRHLLAISAVNDQYNVTEDTPFTLGAFETLITRNSEWDYLDEITNGQNFPQTPAEDYPLDADGDQWFESDFNVETSDVTIGAWKTGQGILGSGGISAFANQTTLAGLGDGVNGQNSVTTYLFRREFTISEQTLIANPEYRLWLLADDGGILYINGVEVFHTSNFATPADVETTTFTNGIGFESYRFTRFDPATVLGAQFVAQLHAGVNTIAFELHQPNFISSDAGFDLSLTASAAPRQFADLLSNDLATDLAGSLHIIGPDNPQLFSTQHGTVHLNLDTDATGQDIGFTYVPDPNFTGVDQFYYALIDVVDGTIVDNDIAEVRLFVNPVNDAPLAIGGESFNVSVGDTLTVDLASYADHTGGTTVMPFGSTWRYLDEGTDPGDTWPAPGFNDSLWRSGPAELGYGDGDEVTEIRFGPDDNNANNNFIDKFITTYFRHNVVLDAATVAAAVADGLIFNLTRDDGAAVYINGTEVIRDNLKPATGDAAADRADVAFQSDMPSENATVTHWINGDVLSGLLLPNTENTIAVEVHQGRRVSSDVSFDLEVVLPEAGTSVGLLANDTDVDGDVLTAILVAAPEGLMIDGIAAVAGQEFDGTFTYTPPVDTPSGTIIEISYTVSDGTTQAAMPVTAQIIVGDTRPDFNGDGVVNLRDLATLQASLANGNHTADANGDGLTNRADVVAFLAAYGSNQAFASAAAPQSLIVEITPIESPADDVPLQTRAASVTRPSQHHRAIRVGGRRVTNQSLRQNTIERLDTAPQNLPADNVDRSPTMSLRSRSRHGANKLSRSETLIRDHSFSVWE